MLTLLVSLTSRLGQICFASFWWQDCYAYLHELLFANILVPSFDALYGGREDRDQRRLSPEI
jgi:hypothetical protein